MEENANNAVLGAYLAIKIIPLAVIDALKDIFPEAKVKSKEVSLALEDV